MVEPHYDNLIDLLEGIPKDLFSLTLCKCQQVYNNICRKMKFSPYSFPLNSIKGKGGSITLATYEIGTSQLRVNYSISTSVKSQELLPYEEKTFNPDRRDITVTRYLAIVTVIATCGGRSEEATEAVEAYSAMVRSNALKKAETQAWRRATLAICGNGWSKPKLAQSLQMPLKIEVPELELLQTTTKEVN